MAGAAIKRVAQAEIRAAKSFLERRGLKTDDISPGWVAQGTRQTHLALDGAVGATQIQIEGVGRLTIDVSGTQCDGFTFVSQGVFQNQIAVIGNSSSHAGFVSGRLNRLDHAGQVFVLVGSFGVLIDCANLDAIDGQGFAKIQSSSVEADLVIDLYLHIGNIVVVHALL